MHLDSFEFPAKNYGDLAYRLYGKWFRWLVNVGQGLQLLLSVGNIIISNGCVPLHYPEKAYHKDVFETDSDRTDNQFPRCPNSGFAIASAV